MYWFKVSFLNDFVWHFGKIFHLKRWQLLHLLYQQSFLSLKKVDWKKQMGLKSAKSFNKSRLKLKNESSNLFSLLWKYLSFFKESTVGELPDNIFKWIQNIFSKSLGLDQKNKIFYWKTNQNYLKMALAFKQFPWKLNFNVAFWPSLKNWTNS